MDELNTQHETAPVQEQQAEEDGFSFDDVIFGNQGRLTGFEAPEEAVAPSVPADPSVQPPPVMPQTPVEPESNDERRYQYWQSETDKARNALQEKEQELAAMQRNIQSQVQEPPAQQAAEEQFPPPPEKPERPAGFNREEAYADSMSDSARYLQSVDQWRDGMDEYHNLRYEYQNAKIAAERQEQQEIMQADKQEKEQTAAMQSYLRDNFGADDSTVNDFIQKMSTPESISMDNLWKLYQMDNVANVNPAAPPQAPMAQPSPEFQQAQRAQSIPNPMGVMPASTNQAQTRSPEDMIMDGLIEDYKGKDPWT